MLSLQRKLVFVALIFSPFQTSLLVCTSTSTVGEQLPSPLSSLPLLFESANGTRFRCVLGATIDSVCKKFKLPKPELNNVINLKESSEEESAGRSNAANSEEDDVPTYVSLRAEALHHKSEREYNFKKAQDAYRTGMKSVAYHYAQQAHLHDRKCKDANRQAANAILEYRRSLHPPTTVDLHGLYVPEALAAVSELLSNAGPKQTLKVITGKGTHSSDGPKIGPAVVKYLTQKKLEFSESTPGVILVKT